MQYRNKRTGAVIETLCAVSGEDWERVEPAKAAAPEAQTAPKKAPRKKATAK